MSCTRFTACEHIILLGTYLVVKMVHIQLPARTLNSPTMSGCFVLGLFLPLFVAIPSVFYSYDPLSYLPFRLTDLETPHVVFQQRSLVISSHHPALTSSADRGSETLQGTTNLHVFE